MRIWKFELPIEAEVVLEMPSGGEVVLIGNQNGTLCMWIKIDQSQPVIHRAFYVIGTGTSFPATLHHLGSAIVGEFVWHVFERAV